MSIYNVGVSGYNAYLIQAGKNVLIDTVPFEYAGELIKNIGEYISVEELDYIVINHTSYERCSSLCELLKIKPDVAVISTVSGLKNIHEQLNGDFNELLAKSNMTLRLDTNNTLKFFITHNIDWPDSMMTYMDGILFSCDAFSDEGIGIEGYYIENLSHMSDFVYSAMCFLETVDIAKILPASGEEISDCKGAIKLYKELSEPYDGDNRKVSVIYYSKTGNTEKLAKHCEQFGISVYNVVDYSKKELLDVIYKSRGVIFATPTHNRNIPFEMASLLMSINHFKITDKLFASFGSYGWSGEAPNLVYSILRARHFETYSSPFRYLFSADEFSLSEFDKFIKAFYEKIINI